MLRVIQLLAQLAPAVMLLYSQFTLKGKPPHFSGLKAKFTVIVDRF